jgi:hypothetical protein
MNITQLPQLPPENAPVSLIGIDFAGPRQYAFGVMFVRAANGEALSDVEYITTIGDPHFAPWHVFDSMARDYALLPESLTASAIPMGICCVREALPACERCAAPGRYDIWASPGQCPALLCERCAEPLDGLELGVGSATYIFTLAEMHWEIRLICDRITSELGRPSLWP